MSIELIDLILLTTHLNVTMVSGGPNVAETKIDTEDFFISNISVTRLHAQLIFRTVIKKLWTFFEPLGRDHFQSPQC